MSFKKNDLTENKPDWSLFPFDGAELVVRVLEHGAQKYARDNWRQGATDPEAQRRIWSAMIRHLAALQAGENVDPESGLPHVAHVACNALFLCAFRQQHTLGLRTVSVTSETEPPEGARPDPCDLDQGEVCREYRPGGDEDFFYLLSRVWDMLGDRSPDQDLDAGLDPEITDRIYEYIGKVLVSKRCERGGSSEEI